MLRQVRSILMKTASEVRPLDGDVAELLTRLAKDEPLCQVAADEDGDVQVIDLPAGEIEVLDTVEDWDDISEEEW